jgi:hypothetical protein
MRKILAITSFTVIIGRCLKAAYNIPELIKFSNVLCLITFRKAFLDLLFTRSKKILNCFHFLFHFLDTKISQAYTYEHLKHVCMHLILCICLYVYSIHTLTFFYESMNEKDLWQIFCVHL